MSKFKKIYILIPIILLLIIFIFLILFTKTPQSKYSVKGLIAADKYSDFNDMTDLGKYEKRKSEIYNKYPGYILTDGSDFNILRILGIEVKYPSDLTNYRLDENKMIVFTDKSKKISLVVKNIENKGNKTAKEFLEDLKKTNDSAMKGVGDYSKNVDVKYELKDNEIIKKVKWHNLGDFTNIYMIDNNNIKFLSLYFEQPENLKNMDNLIDNIINSFKLKD